MQKKQMIGIFALFIVGCIGLLVLIVYTTVKTKSINIAEHEPFKEWIGQTLILNRPTAIYRENIRMDGNNDYPYTLLDSMHPKWQYVEERKNIGDIREITKLAEGSKLQVEKAIQYTNSVSGFSYPMIFGKISINGITYKIGYQWGTRDIGKRFDNLEKCWQFHLAPWQQKIDTNFYSLPTAKF